MIYILKFENRHMSQKTPIPIYKVSAHAASLYACGGGMSFKGVLTITGAGVGECSIVCWKDFIAQVSLLFTSMKLWLHPDTDNQLTFVQLSRAGTGKFTIQCKVYTRLNTL